MTNPFRTAINEARLELEETGRESVDVCIGDKVIGHLGQIDGFVPTAFWPRYRGVLIKLISSHGSRNMAVHRLAVHRLAVKWLREQNKLRPVRLP